MPEIYDHGDPTNEEQYMLELINRARADPAKEAARFGIDLNEGLRPNEITASPKQPLAFNKFLLKAAREHSQWMVDADTFSHTGKGGSSVGSRIQAAGYVGGTGEAENIAHQDASTDLTKPVAEAHQDLFVDHDQPGRGHRINILSHHHEVGIGVKVGEYKGNQAVLITQDFIYKLSPDSAKFLVRVVYLSSFKGYGLYVPGLGAEGCKVTLSKGDTYAITSSSGGYAIPIDLLSGSLTVVFDLGFWKVKKTVELISGESIKVDWRVPLLPTVLWSIMKRISKFGFPRLTPGFRLPPELTGRVHDASTDKLTMKDKLTRAPVE